MAWIDESDYYYIKVENDAEAEGQIEKRTLVLDNLIHGYFILDHPERLDYDYEHIYALVAYRPAKSSGKVKFKPVGRSSETAQDLKGADPSKKDEAVKVAGSKTKVESTSGDKESTSKRTPTGDSRSQPKDDDELEDAEPGSSTPPVEQS